MGTYLDSIVAWHRARAAADGRDPARLAEAALEASSRSPARDFLGALRKTPTVAVIGEVKRRSPSKGDLALDLDPGALAAAYEAGGAACLSVLTDGEHFGGSARDLERARAVSGLPVLRKDFTVSLKDVYDARCMGADAVLLIAATLSDGELDEYSSAAAALEMVSVVEVHDEEEVRRALSLGASLIGVNQRDLRTFAVDTERAARVAAAIPDGVVKLAESGIVSREQVVVLAEAGYDAVLVGERLVTGSDPCAAVRELAGVARGAVRTCG